jgi:D-alanine-D-alanine ligase
MLILKVRVKQNMANHKKIQVAVLFGGRSGEHEISLQSAASVMQHIDKRRYDVIPVNINKQGHWSLDQQAYVQLQTNQTIDLNGSLNSELAAVSFPGQKSVATLFSKVIDGKFDVVFPVLHGPLGEDGTVQGLLEMADLPYVGAGVLSSAVGMDKDIAKRLIQQAGLAIVPYIAVNAGAWEINPQYYQEQILEQLGYPVFVKPANLGSSVGVQKVKTPSDLLAAVRKAFHFDQKILIEQAMQAREIELSVLQNSIYGQAPKVSVPGEIEALHEFYSYEAKYLDEQGAKLHIPADLTATQIAEAQAIAGRSFECLECEGMARVDLFLDQDSGKFIFNEINTIPGFTQISMYPKLWQESGLAYTDLLTELIELALSRYKRKQAFREYQLKG